MGGDGGARGQEVARSTPPPYQCWCDLPRREGFVFRFVEKECLLIKETVRNSLDSDASITSHAVLQSPKGFLSLIFNLLSSLRVTVPHPAPVRDKEVKSQGSGWFPG